MNVHIHSILLLCLIINWLVKPDYSDQERVGYKLPIEDTGLQVSLKRGATASHIDVCADQLHVNDVCLL